MLFGRLIRKLAQNVWTRQGSKKLSDDKGLHKQFYKVSTTCQIPELSRIYEIHLGQEKAGCFVEVGAYDGEYVSNTSCLADLGWRGFYIEPVPEYAERCRERHRENKAIVVTCCAIGARKGVAELYVGEALSTVKEEMKTIFDDLSWARGKVTNKKITAKMLTLEQFLRQHEVKPGFQLLCVDVEGGEWDVFRPFDLRKWRPKMVVVELHDHNDEYLPVQAECRELASYFRRHEYVVVWKDLSNTIYVSQDP